jgi:hypothetical protein
VQRRIGLFQEEALATHSGNPKDKLNGVRSKIAEKTYEVYTILLSKNGITKNF